VPPNLCGRFLSCLANAPQWGVGFVNRFIQPPIPAATGGCGPLVAVGATYVALLDFSQDLFDGSLASGPKVEVLLASHVVKLKHDGITLAAIHTGMGTEVVPNGTGRRNVITAANPEVQLPASLGLVVGLAVGVLTGLASSLESVLGLVVNAIAGGWLDFPALKAWLEQDGNHRGFWPVPVLDASTLPAPVGQAVLSPSVHRKIVKGFVLLASCALLCFHGGSVA